MLRQILIVALTLSLCACGDDGADTTDAALAADGQSGLVDAGGVELGVSDMNVDLSVDAGPQDMGSGGLSITSITPSSGAGAGGTAFVIVGVGFTSATAVTFGGVSAASHSVISDSVVSGVTPVHAAGTVDVAVVTPRGTATLSGGFVFAASATIDSVSPVQGPSSGGAAVTILGSGFLATTAVRFGTAPVTSFEVVSDTRIDAVTGPSSAGLVDLTVVGPAGATVANNVYRYFPRPVITSISPTTGPTSGHQMITLAGTGFTGTTGVRFGSTPVSTIAINSDTQVLVTRPDGVAGTVHITLTTPGGTSATSSATQFTYTP